jgi:hypothetical protein
MVAFFAGHVIVSQAPSAATPLLAVALLLGSLTIALPRRVSIPMPLAVAPAPAPASAQHVPALERGG